VKRYLVDTTPLAALLQGRTAAVTLLQSLLVADELATSMLVYGEIVEYLQGLPDTVARQQDLEALLQDIFPFNLTYPILARYAMLRRSMRRPQGPGIIGDVDTLIAATALEHTVTLITCDTDFDRVPGLMLMKIDRTSLRS
jgi:predicted nucleic acid-binding protein